MPSYSHVTTNAYTFVTGRPTSLPAANTICNRVWRDANETEVHEVFTRDHSADLRIHGVAIIGCEACRTMLEAGMRNAQEQHWLKIRHERRTKRNKNEHP